MSDYQRIERNIQFIAGSYRVLMTRRPKNVYGGRFATLEEARVRRDGLESLLAARRPWALAPRKAQRRTMADLRAERREAGVCQACGEEQPRPGVWTCDGCLAVAAAKRRAMA